MKITYALWSLPIRGETVLEQAVNSYNQHFNPLFPYGERRYWGRADDGCAHFNPLSPYRLRPHSYNGYVGVFT